MGVIFNKTLKNYIFIISDIHENFDFINNFIENKIKLNELIEQDIENNLKIEIKILICGDFGYYPNMDDMLINGKFYQSKGIIKNYFDKIKDNIKIYWVPGNHENHEYLDKLELKDKNSLIEIEKDIFYCAFGSILEINEYKIMFCGGAASIDKQFRTSGFDWFPGEEINYKDILKLKNIKKNKFNYFTYLP